VSHEQNATDDNLVYLSTKDIWGCAFNIDFDSINEMQQTAQDVLNRFTEYLQQQGYTVSTV